MVTVCVPGTVGVSSNENTSIVIMIICYLGTDIFPSTQWSRQSSYWMVSGRPLPEGNQVVGEEIEASFIPHLSLSITLLCLYFSCNTACRPARSSPVVSHTHDNYP